MHVLLTDGTVKAWGDNECGLLGDGTLAGHPTPGVRIVNCELPFVDAPLSELSPRNERECFCLRARSR